jgi:hypothetical protein
MATEPKMKHAGRAPTERAAANAKRRVALRLLTCCEHVVQGRGFREPMELEDRLQAGQFEALPSDKSGPGPAKCEAHGAVGLGVEVWLLAG